MKAINYSAKDMEGWKEGGVGLTGYTKRNAINAIDDLIDLAERLKYKISEGISLSKATQRSQTLESYARMVSGELDAQVLAELEKGAKS